MSGSEAASISIGSTDGVTLAADLRTPDDATAAAVLCHPHPAYGGDRFNNVVGACFDALPAHGVRTLRFDFRDALRTPSADVTGGVDAAARDVAAAVTAASSPEITSSAGSAEVPLMLVGYSYGALAALEAIRAGLLDTDLAALVLIAPPLTVGSTSLPQPLPTLVAVPEHDQFCAPDAALEAIAGWPAEVRDDVDLVTVAMADHFLAGRTGAVVDETVDWLSRRGLLRPPL